MTTPGGPPSGVPASRERDHRRPQRRGFEPLGPRPGDPVRQLCVFPQPTRPTCNGAAAPVNSRLGTPRPASKAGPHGRLGASAASPRSPGLPFPPRVRLPLPIDPGLARHGDQVAEEAAPGPSAPSSPPPEVTRQGIPPPGPAPSHPRRPRARLPVLLGLDPSGAGVTPRPPAASSPAPLVRLTPRAPAPLGPRPPTPMAHTAMVRSLP